MAKIKLDVEDLAVDSFATTRERELIQGTVRGHFTFPGGCDDTLNGCPDTNHGCTDRTRYRCVEPTPSCEESITCPAYPCFNYKYFATEPQVCCGAQSGFC